jgi:hypothetical protein
VHDAWLASLCKLCIACDEGCAELVLENATMNIELCSLELHAFGFLLSNSPFPTGQVYRMGGMVYRSEYPPRTLPGMTTGHRDEGVRDEFVIITVCSCYEVTGEQVRWRLGL